MKKLILLILLLFPFKVDAISASAYIVMDSDNYRVLEGSNIHTPYLIASTTKIMTAMVVINNSKLSEEIIIGEEVLKSYGSGIYVEVGEKIKIQDLLYGLMLRSGNDAAMALEHHIGGSKEGFVYLMNETAKSIGMKNTTFLNGHGLEENNKEGNKSSVYDMGLLSSYAIKNSYYKTISSTKKHTVTTNYKTYIWHNKNKLLNTYDYCTGGKTGFTELAKRTLVTNASKDNINLTIITFKDGNDFEDHRMLYEKYFNNYQSYKLVKKGKIKTKYKNTYIKNDINMTLNTNEYNKINTKINYYNKNVTNMIGEVEVSLNGKSYLKEKIYLDDNPRTEKISFWKKIIRKFGFNG
ncbi:MAG: D-alanyl-D-alanine carboxypeptidase [Bacilli bacterium]|nr:D-alanyl-D-alanine carboxypeptidase [Bacilli bacterium]